jgi:YggT family protein
VVAETLVQIVSIFFQLYILLLLARILLSWVNLDPHHPVVRFLYNVTEPVLAPVRRILPPSGMFDLSPMVVMIGAIILRQLLVSLIRSLF